MSEPIISVSGLRGIVGESLTPLVAARYVAAFAGTLGPGPIVVSRDGRASGPMLAQIVCGTLAACGRDVLYADVAATPTLGVLVRQHQAAGGVQISASHNPPPYNGLKLFGADGRVLPAAAGQPVLEAYRASRCAWATLRQARRGPSRSPTRPASICGSILATVDVEAIRAAPLPRAARQQCRRRAALLGQRAACARSAAR